MERQIRNRFSSDFSRVLLQRCYKLLRGMKKKFTKGLARRLDTRSERPPHAVTRRLPPYLWGGSGWGMIRRRLAPTRAMPPPAISLMGPTASGKTDVAVWLAARFPLDIISVDSALVYRGMDIGTAKPDAATLARAPHRLIDLVEPTEAYSAGRFKRDAEQAMTAIAVAGRIPLLVGGTMLYFRALRGGLDELPAAEPELRAELEARGRLLGWPALHAELARLDPDTAARLKPNDSQRIQRALELCLSTGEPMSRLLEQQPQRPPPPPWLEFALFPADRAWQIGRASCRERV